MACVLIGIGSNIDSYRRITAALNELSQRFGALSVSRVFQSQSIGFDGDDFLNLVVGFQCELSVGQLQRDLRAIEDANGRQRGGPKNSARSLDLDILCYDSLVGVVDGVELPREEILRNAFVLWPLADLVPDALHPVLQRSYGDLWQAFDQTSQRLAPVEFHWPAERLPAANS